MRKTIFLLFSLLLLFAACQNEEANQENQTEIEPDGKGLGLIWNDNAYEAMPRKPTLVRIFTED